MNYFIFNPISGSYGQEKKRRLLNLIQEDPENIVFETIQKDDEITLTQKAISLGAKRVIAIGGDGTINKVASILNGTDIPLGIIPMGSGNGLAHHLKIPLNTRAAFKKSISSNTIKIDVCRVDEKSFVCTAGFGFDAFVADIFDKRKKRGLLNYIIAVFISLVRYKPIEISINDEPSEKLFLLTISNANQYGNNAFISPNADIQDGQFEIIKIKYVSKPKLAFIALRLFLKNIHQSSDVEITKMDMATVKMRANQLFHIDGESLKTYKDDIFISIQTKALKVII
ncbi:MAG: Diacylglycerol kinase [Bacteroidota bacterium]